MLRTVAPEASMSEPLQSVRRAVAVGTIAIALASQLSSCRDSSEPVHPSAASLSVEITGLPPEATASVVVTGPGGFTRTLSTSAVLSGLEPGSYTISPAEVRSVYAYRAHAQTVDVPASAATVPVTVQYAAATGTIAIIATGLPSVPAAGRVTGPNGFDRVIGESPLIEFVEPGAYTFAAADVTLGTQVYTPSPATQALTVVAGAVAQADVAYSGPAPAVGLQLVVNGLTNPVYLTSPPGDERLFVVEQPGRIRVVENGQLLATPFLDISSRVSYGGERGLLSVAFDPAYATNGLFYVYLTNPAGDIAVERYGSTPGNDVANPSPTTVLTIPHPTNSNHNGGLVMFGPDGMLYLGTGDGGGSGDPSGNAQNLSSYLGKILRIDVHGGATLPHVLTRSDIWDWGLRNPWRFEVVSYPDIPDYSDLFIADVGQDHYEEIDVAYTNSPGRNFDWNRMEGRHCYPSGETRCTPTDAFDLAYEYDHSEGCSIVGGFVYQGAAIPWLQYSYLFSDYCGGWLRSVIGNYVDVFTATSLEIPPIGNVLSFGKDAHGELYILSATGAVYKIVPK
jgi:glucose/arabinose dehydrogenase